MKKKILFCFLFFSYILILYTMSGLVWGLLQKSQNDDETIEEAIDRIIAEHNDDPDSHVEAGQSLQSHKAANIIDHVVGSVLADKITMTEMVFKTLFESIDGWGTLGSVSNSDMPGVSLYAEYGEINESQIYSQPQVPKGYRSSAKNMLFQIIAHFDFSNTHLNSWFGYLDGYSANEDGFGFVVRDGVLKAHLTCGGNTQESAALSIDLSLDHVYRVQYDSTNQDAKFYIDGTLVATLVRFSGSWADDMGPRAGVELTETNDGYFRIGELYSSRQI